MATKKAATAKAAKVETEAQTHDAFEAVNAFGDAARDQYDSLLKAFNDNAEEMRGKSEEMLAAMRETFEAAQEKMQAYGAEAMTLARDDMKEAVDFANELARAKTVTDALEIQRAYWSRFFETRVERTRAFTQDSVEFAREAMEPLNKTFAAPFSFAPAFEKLFPFATK